MRDQNHRSAKPLPRLSSMTKPRRKIIFFWTYLEWGGAQVYFMAIMKEAMKEWDVITVLPRNSSPEMICFLKQIGITIEYIDFHIDLGPAPTMRRKIARQWSRIRCEAATLRFLSRYDLSESILHIETCPWQSWQFLTLLSLRKANVFVTMHNAINGARWRELIWKARMQFVSRLPGFHIFTSNKDAKNKIRHLVAPRFWDEISVTYTCVDPIQIQNVIQKKRSIGEIRAQHGYPETDFVVLCVGQFIDRKGRWVFLDAARLLEKKNPNVRFVWLTPVEPTAEESERIRSYNLQNFKLILSSSVGSKREEILEFFRIADVFALPSYLDGLPIALLEAMALGIPSVSTNVYAIPEAVHHRETGLLIKPGDAASLASAILELKNDDVLREKIAVNGSKYVLEHFDECVASQRAIAKYKECFSDAV